MDQQRDFAGAATVWEAAAGPFRTLLDLERSLAEQATALAEAGDAVTEQALARYDRDLERFQREDGYSIAARIDAVLHGLGFDPDDARTRALDGLSGGERGRLGLVRQLVAPADLLLLDEPTNHLDLETTRWLETYLRQLDATVLVVSHDRAFLQAVVDHVLHLEAGTAVAYTGDYEAFVRQRARAPADPAAGVRQAVARAGRRRGLHPAEHRRAEQRPGKGSAAAAGAGEPAESTDRARTARWRCGSPRTSGAAIRCWWPTGSGSRWRAGRWCSAFSARVNRGDVVGFIGPNGAGKSTLIRAIVGDRAPDAGEIRVPDSVRIAYYRQDLAQVPQDRTLYEIIADLRPSWGRGPIQGHLGRFGFSGDSVLRRSSSLSGGETARVALAMMMLSGANFLIFDEPTNHLDVESIEALEDAIEAFDGTVLLVSHDRALLRALTTRMWVLHEGASPTSTAASLNGR